MKTAVWIETRKKKIQCLKEEDGSFTVEASFLVPMVCFLMFGIMQIGLFFCDLNQAKSFLNRRVLEVACQEEYGLEEREKDQKQLEKQLFFIKIEKFVISKTDSRASGEVDLRMDLSVPLVGNWIGKVWKNHFSYSAEAYDHVEWMRRWDQLE